MKLFIAVFSLSSSYVIRRDTSGYIQQLTHSSAFTVTENEHLSCDFDLLDLEKWH